MVGSKENYKFDVGVKGLIFVTAISQTRFIAFEMWSWFLLIC